MKQVSNAYKMAMAKHYRDHAYMVVSIGIITNEAQSSAKIVSEMNYLSNNKSLFVGKNITKTYATLEENVFKADGSLIFPQEDNEYFQLASVVSALSKDILGIVTVQFDNTYDLKGLTVNFGEYYPTALQIILDSGETYTYENSAETFITTDNFDAVKKFTIKPLSFVNGDNKRLRVESMLMGVGISFQSEDIETSTLTDFSSFISTELPQINFEVKCFDKNKLFNVDDSNSFINYLETGQLLNNTLGIELADGSVEWVQMPLTYLTKWSSDTDTVTLYGADRFHVFLTDKYESSNYIHTRTLYAEALKIMNELGLAPDEYFIDDVLMNITITNPMPEVNYAEALQLVANAGRCVLKQDAYGRLTLTPNFENIVEPTDLVVETDSEADWSKPDNIRTGSTIIYADLTQNFMPVDGSMFFIPDTGEGFLETGFISRKIADEDGNFDIKPTLSMSMPATYTYYGIDFIFGGNVPEQFTINVYDSDELKDTVKVNNPTKEFHLDHPFYGFDKIEIQFDKGQPNDRVILQKIAFANLTDYRLVKEDMFSNPLGTVEIKIKSIRVKVFTYVEEEEETEEGTKTHTVLVDDNVYYEYVLNTIGEVITFENELISTMDLAKQVGEWIANYYANNVTYKVDYRGEPRIESGDYIFMDSDVLNNLQVEVDSHTINYNGALSGKLELRRAVNMIS